MKAIFSVICYLFCITGVQAQELYVNTEPASNMAAGSLGLRWNTRFYKMENNGNYTYRLDPEIMVGLNRNLMLHFNAYASDMYQPNLRFEGGSIYAKYRFYSSDDVHSHFRLAAEGKMALINNPTVLQVSTTVYAPGPNGQPTAHQELVTFNSDEIDLNGNNSGFLAGFIGTQLLHKLAISSSVRFLNRWNNLEASTQPGQSRLALDYSLSGGFLLFPVEYKDFHQTNLNLYCEFLASTALDKNANYIDIAPAIQLIFNSISRLDISYRTQIAGNMERLSRNSFMIRYEYNFLNLFGPLK